MPTVRSKDLVKVRSRVLVVDDEPVVRDLIQDVVESRLECQFLYAANLSEARGILSKQPIDLLVTDLQLPDGDGINLLSDLRRKHPGAAAMVISGAPTMDGAIGAMRGGAVDFLSKPFSADYLADRLKKALLAQRVRDCQERRFEKLKETCKRLNKARRVVTKKVDLLCHDLIAAYGALSREMDGVRIQESFRGFIEKTAGLEQLLCHSMDWMLRQVGYCNIGIWLAAEDQELQLGAFMKYTVAAEEDLLDAMQKNVLRLAVRRGFVRLNGPEAKGTLSTVEAKYLADQDVIVINCTYLGEALGVIALFRDHQTPFSEDDVNAIKTACPLFALALARAVKGLGMVQEGESEEMAEEESADEPRPNKKRDPADWWKNGEPPPF